MNIQFDRNTVLKCYNECLTQIQELEAKRQTIMDSATPYKDGLVKRIDAQLSKLREEFSDLQYALDNMT